MGECDQVRTWILAVLAMATLTASCDQAPEKKAVADAPAQIRFVTDWKAQAEHGGFYQALAKGFYEKHGLKVRLIEGGPSVNVPQMLVGGAADFGIGSNGFIPLNLVREGAPVRAVMAVFQKDPQVLMTHPRADVTSIADMKGKPILISDAATAAFWPWLKAKFGFTDKQIRKYTFNLAPFVRDPKAIQEGYLSSEPYSVEKEAGFKPQIFLMADEGYPGYANMVLVTQKWIDRHPDQVRAFVQASIEGWVDYLYGDPAPGDALIKRDSPEMTDDILAQARAKIRDFGIAGLKDHIGQMDAARWDAFYMAMRDVGVYAPGLDVRKAYDTRFLKPD